ncbi:MAG: nucleotide pyrophosphohydrolase [Azoarcus sp.]|jgi:NTP pyrophosphatase (non-canonical NTP hydrolase)|nr:nucleotide pyrophosphohydrolase [Azoarcus sp.]
MNIGELTQAQVKFRDERNWAQFHTLRNLIVSLNLEASELLELTQWKSDSEIASMLEDDKQMEALRDECSDVLLYLLLIAEKSGFDLLRAASTKLEKNALKYPVEKSYGSSRKYTELD